MDFMDFMDGLLGKCRLCLKLGQSYSIFKKDQSLMLSEMAMECARVKICEGDGLPDKICYDCVPKLSGAYLFKLQCERAEKELLQKLIVPPAANITENMPRASSPDVSAISSLREDVRSESLARKRRCESVGEATLGRQHSVYRRSTSVSNRIEELCNKSIPMTPQEHSSTNTTTDSYSVDVNVSYFFDSLACHKTSINNCLRDGEEFQDSLFAMKSSVRNTDGSVGEADVVDRNTDGCVGEADTPRNNVDDNSTGTMRRVRSLDLILSLRQKVNSGSYARKRRYESNEEATLGSQRSDYPRSASASNYIDELSRKPMPMTSQRHSSTNTTMAAYSVDVDMSYFSDESLFETCLDTSIKKCISESKDFNDDLFAPMKSPARNTGETEVVDIPRNNVDAADVNNNQNSKNGYSTASAANIYMKDDTTTYFDADVDYGKSEVDDIPNNNVNATDNNGNVNCTNCKKTFRLQTMLENHLESCGTPQPQSPPSKELRIVLEPIDKLLKQTTQDRKEERRHDKKNVIDTAAETANASVADTGVISVPCLYCSMTFEDYYAHNAHFNACPQRDVSLPYQCPLCNRVMAKKVSYTLHIRNKHFYPKPTKPKMTLCRKQKKSKFEHCRICNKKLASKNSLITHLLKHMHEDDNGTSSDSGISTRVFSHGNGLTRLQVD